MSEATNPKQPGGMDATVTARGPDEPFPCPNCGQMLGASCRVCVACKQPVDSARVAKAARLQQAPQPASPSAPVERAHFSWQIFFFVLAAWLMVAMVLHHFLGPVKSQWVLGGFVVLSSAWVFFDAQEKRVPKPFRWSMGALLFWILIFPWYLSRRRTPQAACPFVEAEVGPVARALLLVLVLFFLFTLAALIMKGPPPK